MHFQQQYSKAGSSSLPRSWRALKGWRRRAPSRSRIAFPLQVWAGLAGELCLCGHWSMATYVLWCLVTYNRPNEPLTIRRQDLNKPMHGVSPAWTVLLWPSERDGRSKVLGSDDSLPLSTARYCRGSRPSARCSPRDHRRRRSSTSATKTSCESSGGAGADCASSASCPTRQGTAARRSTCASAIARCGKFSPEAGGAAKGRCSGTTSRRSWRSQ